MKILLISPFENENTGRGDRYLKLRDALRQNKHHVTFLTGDFDHAKKRKINPVDNSESKHDITVPMIPYYTNISPLRIISNIWFAVNVAFYGLYRRWDVIIINSIPPEALFAASFSRALIRVMDVRDIWPDALNAYGVQSIKAKVFVFYCNFLYRVAVKRMNLITTVAPEFKSWIKRFTKICGSKIDIRFIPLGFSKQDFAPAITKDQYKYAFCYAGGATPQFDIREFANSYYDRSGIVLGSGPLLNAWKDAFPAAEFPGVVSKSEAINKMNMSEIVLFPSNPYACLPNKAFDYFALGKQVEYGRRTTRSVRYLLELRRKRRALGISDTFTDYRVLEKEYLAERFVKIIEKAAIKKSERKLY